MRGSGHRGLIFYRRESRDGSAVWGPAQCGDLWDAAIRERLLGDALTGDGAFFTREDAVEAAWVVVDPVLKGAPQGSPLQGPKLGAGSG